ncbi:hypothetical protein [Endozoicomonas sp. 2B-B]
MTKTLQKQAVVLTVVMKTLSVICTGWLFFSMAGNPWIGGLTAAGGVVVQWLAFLITPFGLLWILERQWLRGVMALLYGLVVFTVSTLAAVAFLEQGEQSYRKDSERYTSITSVIALRAEAARKDIDSGYRDRALNTLDKIEVQDQKRSTLTSDSPFAKTAELYGVDSEQARRFTFLIFALLLDGGAVLASCLIALERRQEQEREHPEPRTETQEEQEQEQYSETIEQEPAETEASKLDEARQLIGEQMQGDMISVRFVKDRLKVGYPKAKHIIKQLEQMGLIAASGKSFIVNGE